MKVKSACCSACNHEWSETHDVDIETIPCPSCGDVPTSIPKGGHTGSSSSVLNTQEGGDHYKGKSLQPWHIINANGLDFYEGNALKYLLRHKDKNGAEDIDKAIHYLQAIKEFKYGK